MSYNAKPAGDYRFDDLKPVMETYEQQFLREIDIRVPLSYVKREEGNAEDHRDREERGGQRDDLSE